MRSAPLMVAVLLLAAAPREAAAFTLGKPPIIDSVTTTPTPAPPNSSAAIACAARDTDGLVRTMTITVAAGSLPNGAMSQAVAIAPAATVTGSIAWMTPGPGTYSVTCSVTDNGYLRASRTVQITVSAPASQPPVITSLTASASNVLVGGSVQLSAAATDPEGDPLSWSWTATGGTLQANGDSATWIAPANSGSFSVTATVSDPSGQSASQSVVIQSALLLGQDGLAAAFRAPRRVASAPSGELYVVDAASGQLWLLTRRGEARTAPQLAHTVTAVTHCAGMAVVSTASGKLLKVDPEQGKLLGEVALAGGRLAGPAGLACDEATGRVFVAERELGRVRAIEPDGSTAFLLTTTGTTQLRLAADVAVDAAAGLLWVVLATNESGALAHAFTLSGAFVRSVAPFGSGDGKVTRAGGVTVSSSGQLHIADTFQGTVAVFDRGGGWLGRLGTFGSATGQLRQPNGMAWLANGDLVVANLDAGRLERFGAGVPLPTCNGDLDCDGLPDAWELAHGLSASNPRDALADADADRLSNLDEFKRGIDPGNSDTDGDGYQDGDEVATGYDPLDPLDHKPVMVAGSPVTSDPGLVNLFSTIQGRPPCTVAWTQTAGPAVNLREASTATPSFVGRLPDTYRFQGVGTCGINSSDPIELVATIRNVPPRPAPVTVTAVQAGKSFLLEGLFSSDSNGGPLVLEWDQLLGTPLLPHTTASAASVHANAPGLLSFQLSATDPLGLTATEEVAVLVVSSGKQAPTAMAQSPAFGRVGEKVTLDASESVGSRGGSLRFSWSQVEGPTVQLSSPTEAKPSFTPAKAGRYGFEVAVTDGSARSPADKVSVYVSEAAHGLPVAAAPASLSGPVGEPLRLDGTGSSRAGTTHPLQHRWRQVSGPAAGLTRADEPVATVVPFAPGVYLFELTVSEGAAVSTPAFVRIDADESGRVRPVASVSAPSVANTSESITLDGTASSGGEAALVFRWRQVSGPWVALDDSTSATPSFTPRTAGMYGFELVVDDGVVQSAPAQVGVVVFPKAGGGAP